MKFKIGKIESDLVYETLLDYGDSLYRDSDGELTSHIDIEIKDSSIIYSFNAIGNTDIKAKLFEVTKLFDGSDSLKVVFKTWGGDDIKFTNEANLTTVIDKFISLETTGKFLAHLIRLKSIN